MFYCRFSADASKLVRHNSCLLNQVQELRGSFLQFFDLVLKDEKLSKRNKWKQSKFLRWKQRWRMPKQSLRNCQVTVFFFYLQQFELCCYYDFLAENSELVRQTRCPQNQVDRFMEDYLVLQSIYLVLKATNQT